MGFNSKRKEFAPFREDPFQKGAKKAILTVISVEYVAGSLKSGPFYATRN